jgi:hypothetical protein
MDNVLGDTMTTDIEPRASETIEAVKSIMPFLDQGATGETKAAYLSYRFTGFSVRESCVLTDIHQKTVQRWRDPDRQWYDADFVEMENMCTGSNRHEVRKEVLSLLFTRNYHLALRKDGEVLMRSLGLDRTTMPDGTVVTLSMDKDDIAYLNKARGHYTPQQMEVIDRMLDPNTIDDFNFTEFAIRMAKRTKVGEEIMEITGRVGD